jgi:multiple sugar transport system substrate-binding protein
MNSSVSPFHRKAAVGATALALSTVILMTGCSRSDTSESPEPAASVSDGAATGDLTIWADSTDADALETLTEAFEKANPDVDVTVTNVPYDDYTTKITTAISGGAVPDMALVGNQALPGYFATGAFEAVPDDLVDPSAFYEGASEAVQDDGVAMGVPLYVETRPLLYRTDIADKAGVEAPKTWDDYLTFAKAAMDAGAKKGMRIETGEEGSTSIIMTDLIWQAGGELMNDDATKWTFDTPEALKAFEFYNSLFTADVVPNPGPEWGTIDAGFVKDDFAAYITGAWSVGLSNEAAGDDSWADSHMGAVTLPTGPSGEGTSVLDGKNWVVFKDAENHDAAWKFAQFMSDPEVQGQWYEASSTLPAVQATWDLPALTDQPLLAAFDDQLAMARPTPAVTTWSEIQTEIQAAAERVSSGAMSPGDSLAELQSRADSIGVGE